jgi:hypothetical protein
LNTYETKLAEHRRLTILRLLAGGSGTANESLLFDCLEDVGLDAGLTRDAVRSDLDFLRERHLVKLEFYDEKLAVAAITERGVDCAKGRILIEGIKRPSLGVA